MKKVKYFALDDHPVLVMGYVAFAGIKLPKREFNRIVEATRNSEDVYTAVHAELEKLKPDQNQKTA